MNTHGITSNQNPALDPNALKPAQSIQASQPVQEQPDAVQQPLRSSEQEPKISPDGSRLAAIANDNDSDDSPPAITNSEEAQKAINQLRADIQSNPGQAVQTQKISAESVRALISAG